MNIAELKQYWEAEEQKAHITGWDFSYIAEFGFTIPVHWYGLRRSLNGNLQDSLLKDASNSSSQLNARSDKRGLLRAEFTGSILQRRNKPDQVPPADYHGYICHNQHFAKKTEHDRLAAVMLRVYYDRIR